MSLARIALVSTLLLVGARAFAQPAPDAPAPTFSIHSKWAVELYGFAEFDSIYDSTQGLIEVAGNSALARPSTYTGDHGQLTFGVRNSRIGLKLAAPTYRCIHTAAQLEMDFFGNQPGTPLAAGSLVSEQAYFQNPAFRIRHANIRIETPALDFLIGQFWQLFGWQSLFHPSTVQIQGVPGQLYSRSPQLRVGKTFNAGDFAVELAVAASRPPERASASPDGQAGIKVGYQRIKALHTSGATGTAVDALSVGVSVVGRRFAVPEFSPTPSTEVTRNGYGLSLDALVPIIPATKAHHDHALTFNASFVTGAGIADLYQSLTGGVANPAVPNPNLLTPAPTYTAGADNGLVLYFPDPSIVTCGMPQGGNCYSLHPIQWQSLLVGLQYYLPVERYTWVAVNYSHMSSDNAHLYGAATKVWDTENWADANLFVDLTPALRLGGEFAYTDQTYIDHTVAKDYRGQLSAFFLF